MSTTDRLARKLFDWYLSKMILLVFYMVLHDVNLLDLIFIDAWRVFVIEILK